jgi:quercetin 2,3-dioxygenase
VTNLEARPVPELCEAHAGGGPVTELYEPREVPLGGLRAMRVRRTLPQRELPMVGAWCFLDEFGPQRVDMRVLPHPHTGLQTVTWPVVGEIRHRDSLGSDVVVRPGQLNLMTAGRGVAHSEVSLGVTPELHAVQLWVALPDDVVHGPAAFEQVTDLPVWESGGARVTVFIGELGGARSSARVHSPLLGADCALAAGSRTTIPLDASFEHAALVLQGAARVGGTELRPGPVLYLGDGRAHLDLEADDDARVLLLGGRRFDHDLVMWWNFVGRSHADIAAAREAWASDQFAARFGVVEGHDGVRIPAPDLPNVRLQPRRRGRPA